MFSDTNIDLGKNNDLECFIDVFWNYLVIICSYMRYVLKDNILYN